MLIYANNKFFGYDVVLVMCSNFVCILYGLQGTSASYLDYK